MTKELISALSLALLWERVMTINAWTKGQKDSLFFIIAPPKDDGNGTLKKGREMWMYNPKVNRVIKLPPSMMSQAWMGSDFSNNDLSKSDSLINDYSHTIVGTETHERKKVVFVFSTHDKMVMDYARRLIHIRDGLVADDQVRGS
ncbi:MAG: hypothetical protein BA872_04040 [Desulfobacterales bacterium C00003060]|nr:MAG: hypothetical protein BA861_02915 [Desulfobacterales bacterium S3730MH5]OEU77533.1 MAG: hypothetical protein BA872_04040 [Desulfobacterales bacterium C00003060]